MQSLSHPSNIHSYTANATFASGFHRSTLTTNRPSGIKSSSSLPCESQILHNGPLLPPVVRATAAESLSRGHVVWHWLVSPIFLSLFHRPDSGGVTSDIIPRFARRDRMGQMIVSRLKSRLICSQMVFQPRQSVPYKYLAPSTVLHNQDTHSFAE
jgi:hypothetical protein